MMGRGFCPCSGNRLTVARLPFPMSQRFYVEECRGCQYFRGSSENSTFEARWRDEESRCVLTAFTGLWSHRRLVEDWLAGLGRSGESAPP